ncbi:hypothetical protein VIGAN_08245000 [Vigna angularis var. angularis]|uniref:Uncharacterized protein n=1 Tax=Vigna angularis var. angularis TaxID=157739 RepID=A0A0S3SS84_PHAAN|nr:hypothetical protein VIGAN_08245000 [Vigna angularis var. angularis]
MKPKPRSSIFYPNPEAADECGEYGDCGEYGECGEVAARSQQGGGEIAAWSRRGRSETAVRPRRGGDVVAARSRRGDPRPMAFLQRLNVGGKRDEARRGGGEVVARWRRGRPAAVAFLREGEASTFRRCDCLPGFEPRSEREWFIRDESGGCMRKSNLSRCGSREGFVEVAHVKVPNTLKIRCAAYTSAKRARRVDALELEGRAAANFGEEECPVEKKKECGGMVEVKHTTLHAPAPAPASKGWCPKRNE